MAALTRGCCQLQTSILLLLPSRKLYFSKGAKTPTAQSSRQTQTKSRGMEGCTLHSVSEDRTGVGGGNSSLSTAGVNVSIGEEGAFKAGARQGRRRQAAASSLRKGPGRRGPRALVTTFSSEQVLWFGQWGPCAWGPCARAWGGAAGL